jgi:hypothetical protein
MDPGRRAEDLFAHGFLSGIQRRLGLIHPWTEHGRNGAVTVLVVTWAPLAVLAAAQQIRTGGDSLFSLFGDFGVGARFLVAAPLLVAAESWCFPRLSKVIHRFMDASILRNDGDRERLRAGIASTRHLSHSLVAEIVIVALAYGLTAALYLNFPRDALTSWHLRQAGGDWELSWASLWHAYVSLPVLFILLLTWIWRQVLWVKMLRVVSKLDLLLIVAHSDRAGGLRFLSGAIRGYWPLGFALGAVTAGTVQNQFMSGGGLRGASYVIAGLLSAVLVVFLAPFLVFIPKLLRLKEAVAFEYGALGLALGEQFELKQVKGRSAVNRETLELQDFSATTDLYSVVTNAYQLRYFPIGFDAIRELLVVTMLPFIPAALSAIPLDVVLRTIGNLLV